MMGWFWVGLMVGVGLTIPMAVFAARRTAGRVAMLERKARSTERLAELGMMTGGLAHEIKNPLSTIGLNVQMIEEDLLELADPRRQGDRPTTSLASDRLVRVTRRFEALSRETKRLRDILDDFLRYAGRVKLDRIETDINDLVAELTDFFEPQALAAGVQLRTQLAADPATVPADPSLLKQAVLNLMVNATQAMSEARMTQGGTAVHGGAKELILRTERKYSHSQDAVLIHVIDTGAGLAPHAVDKVFQPYFSTKSGGGMGLGLPTARRIVEEHGGTLRVHSELGRGCDFVVSLLRQLP